MNRAAFDQLLVELRLPTNTPVIEVFTVAQEHITRAHRITQLLRSAAVDLEPAYRVEIV